MTSSPNALKELSGDGALSPGQRVSYLWGNLWRNLRPAGAGCAKLRVHRLSLPRLPESPATSSPLRALTEAFLAAYLPTLTPPRALEVVEIGCGSGSLAARLAGLGYSGTYTGVDLGDRFKAEAQPEQFSSRFVQGDAHDFTPDRPIDLLVSVSALEHIPDDGRLLERLRSYMAEEGIQVHLLPGAWGLPLYLWHGYRQYSLRAIAERFPTGTDVWVLGGPFSFFTHFVFITMFEMIFRLPLRKWGAGLYRRLLDLSLRADRIMPLCSLLVVAVERRGAPPPLKEPSQ